ncbi:MAG: hypothetical protein ABIG61_02995, partial [Planctomycetota bacterium]
AKGQLSISPQRAIELTQTMYELRFELPNDPEVQHVLLKMDAEQQMLYFFVGAAESSPNILFFKKILD